MIPPCTSLCRKQKRSQRGVLTVPPPPSAAESSSPGDEDGGSCPGRLDCPSPVSRHVDPPLSLGIIPESAGEEEIGALWA
eukprot:1396497-Prymnesium_polylepis.1